MRQTDLPWKNRDELRKALNDLAARVAELEEPAKPAKPAKPARPALRKRAAK